MIALLQRVTQARVVVEQQEVGAIDHGLLVLLGVEREDTHKTADRMLHKILNYRIFSDESGRMNRSVTDENGGLLIVSQFTLPADTRKGMRPSFSAAAPTELGEQLYQYLLTQAQQQYTGKVSTGIFGAHMQITLTNDGPVTFWLQI